MFAGITARQTAPPPKPMPARTRKATRAVAGALTLRSEEEAAVALALAGVGAGLDVARGGEEVAAGPSLLASAAAGKTSIALIRRVMVALAPVAVLAAESRPNDEDAAFAAGAEPP